MRSEGSITMTLYPLRLPPLTPGPGITLRHFEYGDEGIWESLVSGAFDEYRPIEGGFAPEHTWFACIHERPVATASVWYRPELGQHCGYIYRVCARAEFSGRRLGYWVTLAALYQLKREDCPMAILHTDDFRLPAIWTYLNLGFRVVHDSPDARSRWEGVLDRLKLEGEVREMLAVPSRGPFVWKENWTLRE